jgi:hypothetical protein
MKKLFLLCSFCITLVAKDLEDIASQAHIASVNTLLIFTSSEGLNSGRYHFSNVGVDMDVAHLPFTYQLADQGGWNPFVMGNVGYSRVKLSKDIIAPVGGRLDYNNHLRTYTAGLGGGVRYKLSKDLSVLTGLELIYSRSGASVRQPDDDLGDVIEDFFNQNYTNNWSYELLFQGEYTPTLHHCKPYVRFLYKIYDTKATFSFNEMLRLASQSSIATLSFGVESLALHHFNANYITLEGYYHANYLQGDVKDVVKFQAYSTFGGVAYLYTPQKPFWASRFFLELSSVVAHGLEGYNVGVGFTFVL